MNRLRAKRAIDEQATFEERISCFVPGICGSVQGTELLNSELLLRDSKVGEFFWLKR